MTSEPSTTGQLPVGIDLGTTYSVVAYVDSSGRPTTLPNRAGELLTPSALLFEEAELVIGKEAVKSSTFAPQAFADCFKRDMGVDYFRRQLRGIELPPEVLSGFILERLKEDAERRLGPIRQVVITVPAFFDETRRKATQEAGRLAGLEVLDIINEPTAAAVEYGYQAGLLKLDGGGPQMKGKRRVLVYDLGGGTFDVTLLEMEGTEFRAIATDGDVQLGGKDFDERLVNYIAEQFQAAHGVDPRSSAEDAAQMWIDAQEAKHALTERSKTTIVCYHAGLRARVEITREQFEELTRDLVSRTESTTSLLLKQAGMSWREVDRVLLVGGSSRMPAVGEMLRKLTGKEPDRSLSPDEAVAHGAALYAGMLMQRKDAASPQRYRLVNVNSHSLGVVGVDPLTKRRTNKILIPRNSPLPCEVIKKCQTARNDQRSVMVAVVEGESRRPEECIPLGQCVIRNLPPGLPAGSPIQVIYSYAANGRISVSARLPGTRQSAHVEICRDEQRDLQSLDFWRKRLLQPSASSPKPIANPATAAYSAQAAAPSSGDSEILTLRLDELYVQIGKQALTQAMPRELAANVQAAQQAMQSLARAEQHLAQSEARKAAGAGSAEHLQLTSEAAQAKSHLGHARSHAEFSLLVLGRECVQHKVCPAGVESACAEAVRLRAVK